MMAIIPLGDRSTAIVALAQVEMDKNLAEEGAPTPVFPPAAICLTHEARLRAPQAGEAGISAALLTARV
ncbi:hypothetical protein CO659_03870 [Rhizobium sp. S9]|nr:hypothetical protein CO659_03870 [Rhizobium sp. S9]